MAWIECGMSFGTLWLDWRHGSETAEPQQDSSPRGHEFVRGRGAERQLRKLGLESCWGSAVSEPCLQSTQRMPKLPSHTLSTPFHLLRFSGFEAAVRQHVRERIRGPLGLNPWGSAVSEPCLQSNQRRPKLPSHTLSTP